MRIVLRYDPFKIFFARQPKNGQAGNGWNCGKRTAFSIAGEVARAGKLSNQAKLSRFTGVSVLGMATRDQNDTLADLILCTTALVAVGIVAIAALLYLWN
jgi:hypothetical protein